LNIRAGNKVRFKPYLKSNAKKIKLSQLHFISNHEKKFAIFHDIKFKPELGLVAGKADNILAEEIFFGEINLYKANISSLSHGYIDYGNGVPITYGSFNWSFGSNDVTQGSIDEEYYFVQKGEAPPFQIKTGNKKFRQQMDSLMKDNPLVMDSINLKKKNYYDLRSLIKRYNANYIIEKRYLKKNQQKINIEDSIYLSPEIDPEYLQGKEKLIEMVSNVEPTLYAKQDEQFGMVFVDVTFDDKGHLIKIEVPHKIGYGLDEKAIKIIKKTNGSWKSAMDKGSNVFSSMIIPVYFRRYPNELDEKARKFYKQGLKLFKNKKYQKAVTFFETATSINRNFIDAFYFRANCYSHMNRMDDACEFWEKAIQLGLVGQNKLNSVRGCD